MQISYMATQTVELSAEELEKFEAATKPKLKSTKVFWLLWGLLGEFGVHRMYMGKWTHGLLMAAGCLSLVLLGNAASAYAPDTSSASSLQWSIGSLILMIQSIDGIFAFRALFLQNERVKQEAVETIRGE